MDKNICAYQRNLREMLYKKQLAKFWVHNALSAKIQSLKTFQGQHGSECQVLKNLVYICIVMDDQRIYEKIKSTVHSFLPDAQVLLFGSRVNGLVHKDSDYDLLIILDKAIPLKEKMKFQSKIRKALVWALDAPFDVLLKDKDDIERFKNAKGHIIYYALKESVAI